MFTMFSYFFFSKIIKIGDRCEVEPGAKRGVVKYVGRAESIAPGFWVGVQYDEPLGKHDGMYVILSYLFHPSLLSAKLLLMLHSKTFSQMCGV